MDAYGVDAIPFSHEKMDEWRDALRRGISYLDESTNLLITGGIDDLWVNPMGELIVVDYKATSKSGEVGIDADWQISYKRQMEVYQWLFRKNGFNVSKTGYFVYCNGDADKEAVDAKLEFDIKLIPYDGDDSWVDKTIDDIYNCLESEVIPSADPECDYCLYNKAVGSIR
jgi:RecB family exonuclease